MRKHPLAGRLSLPFSRGQLVHGDVIYLRDVETMERSGEADIDRIIQLACLALYYDFVDEAACILQRNDVVNSLRS